jgi:hypothetical protein
MGEEGEEVDRLVLALTWQNCCLWADLTRRSVSRFFRLMKLETWVWLVRRMAK